MAGQAAVEVATTHYTREWGASGPETAPDSVTHPYPWTLPDSPDPFDICTSATQSPHATLLPQILDSAAFLSTLGRMASGKRPGPDGLPNEVLRAMPPAFHAAIHKLLCIFWLCGATPGSWKHSETDLFYKRDSHVHLANYRPIAFTNCLTKLWSRFLADVLSEFAEDYCLLSDLQEGFRRRRSTARQLQRLVSAICDAQNSQSDLFVLYIDFSNAFNTVNHPLLFRIMTDLGFPMDAVAVVRELWTGCTSTVKIGTHGTTHPIPIHRGVLQGSTLSPLLFIIMLEPLMRWLKVGGRGYQFSCVEDADARLRCSLSSPGFADDLALLTNTVASMRTQWQKVCAFSRFAGVFLNPPKCAVTGILHGMMRSHNLSRDAALNVLSSLLTNSFTVPGAARPVPFLPPSKPYPYLGVLLSIALDWAPQLQALKTAILDKARAMLAADVPPLAALAMIDRVIKPKIRHSMVVCPFSMAQIHELDTLLARIARAFMRLGASFPTRALLATRDQHGVGVVSLIANGLHSHLCFKPCPCPQ